MVRARWRMRGLKRRWADVDGLLAFQGHSDAQVQLLPRATYGSAALLQPGSLLMSMDSRHY